jgi:hypothetical protein
MVLGVPLFPMLALSGYIGYKAWPYLSESKRKFPKNVVLELREGVVERIGDILGGIIFTTGVVAIVGLSVYAGYVIWTGQGGFWPTTVQLVATETLIFGLSLGMHWLALELYDQEMLGWGGRDDVAERFSVTTFTLANFAFIPIAVSKLALEVTDNRKTATVAGIMALAVSSALTGAVIYEGFFA